MERSGTIEALTQLFVKLFQETERPENPMEFIRDNFGDSILLQQQIKDLTWEVNELKDENKALKEILQKNGLDAPQTSGDNLQSQSAVSAVEMQEAINKENSKRTQNQKHSGSVDQQQPQNDQTAEEQVPEKPAQEEPKPEAASEEAEIDKQKESQEEPKPSETNDSAPEEKKDEEAPKEADTN